jgi:hypothetical protein
MAVLTSATAVMLVLARALGIWGLRHPHPRSRPRPPLLRGQGGERAVAAGPGLAWRPARGSDRESGLGYAASFSPGRDLFFSRRASFLFLARPSHDTW